MFWVSECGSWGSWVRVVVGLEFRILWLGWEVYSFWGKGFAGFMGVVLLGLRLRPYGVVLSEKGFKSWGQGVFENAKCVFLTYL